MLNIVLVADSNSYLLAALENELTTRGHNIIRIQSDLSGLQDGTGSIDAIFLYFVEDVEESMNVLVYLKDLTIEDSIPLFLMGDEQHIEDVEKMLPEQFIMNRFVRPVDIKIVASELNEYLVNNQSQEKKRILVVDDSGTMLRTVKGWLEDKYQVTLANSGAAAIKSMAIKMPDLLLLDYEMPIVDGGQLLEMLRAETEFARVPVIFLTGNDDRETLTRVSQLKPEGYLLKSMPPEQIVGQIDEFFERTKAGI